MTTIKRSKLVDIKKEHWDTLTIQEIANLYNIKSASVRAYANRHNIPYIRATRQRAEPKPKGETKVQRQLSEAGETLRSIPQEDWQDYTVRQLAQRYNLKDGQIRNFAFSQGILIKKASSAHSEDAYALHHKKSVIHTITPEDWQNLTAQELSEKYQLSVKNIRSFASRRGIKLKHQPKHSFDCRIITPEDWRDYTVAELIDKYNLDDKNQTTLRWYAKKHGIVIRKSYKTDHFEEEPKIIEARASEINEKIALLPSRLIDYRKMLGKNTVEMADYLNFNRIVYGKFEKGQKLLTVNELAMISRKTGLSLDYLILGNKKS